jgi:5'-nucleotidase
MTPKPLILITNDDGIHSPGLRAAAQAVADLGELLIVAPSRQQTGASRSYPKHDFREITRLQLTLNGSDYPAFTADISPAMAVALGYLKLAARPIDLVISGINYGENIGTGVTISGTVGAAIEAACYGLPALAMSLETPMEFHLNHSETVDFSVAGHFTRYFAQKILADGLPAGVDMLKVDVPAGATPETPWQVGRVSRQRYYETPTQITTTDQSGGGFSYHIKVHHDTLETDSDVRIFAVAKQVAVVPMTIDLTAPVALPDVARFFGNGHQ